jgi:hypothetical protein
MSGWYSSHSTVRDALLTECRKALMPDERAAADDVRDLDFQRCATPVSDDRERPAAASVQALPSITHELSEALTAISAYLSGSRHLLEHAGRFDKIQSAIEQANLQAGRANDAVRQLRESLGKSGRT